MTPAVRGDGLPTVFVSHSSEDAAAAGRIRKILNDHGYGTWMAPDDLSGAQPWPDQILAAVTACPVMLVVLSAHANTSPHVAREASIALDSGKPIVPVRIEAVEPTGGLKYLLHLEQWVDAFPPPMAKHADTLLRRLETASGEVRQRTPSDVLDSGAPQEDGPEPGARRGRGRWLVGAALVLVALALVATGLRVTRHDEPSTDPLSRIPASVSTLDDLRPFLEEAAASYRLPPGATGTGLSPHRSVDGSIGVSTPDAWPTTSTHDYYSLDGATVIGSELRTAADRAFDGYTASGVLVAAARPGAQAGDSVDKVFSREQYIDLGCSSSQLVTVDGPVPGEARVWGGCAGGQIFVVAYLVNSDSTLAVMALATTASDARILPDVLDSIQVIPAAIPVARPSGSPAPTSTFPSPTGTGGSFRLG